MKERRKISGTTKFIVASIVVIISIWIGSKMIYQEMEKKNQSENFVLNKYETRCKNAELLQSLPQKVIEEGKGINIKKIPAEIQYSLYKEKDKVIFCYSLGENTGENEYRATITLSENVEILEEEYKFQEQTLSEYTRVYNRINRFLAVSISTLIVLIVLGTILLVIGIVSGIRHIRKYMREKNK